MSVSELLDEDDFNSLLSEYRDENAELIPYPTAFHPSIPSGPCSHTRHPVILEALPDQNSRYSLDSICPVCSVRDKLHALKVLNEIWRRHGARGDRLFQDCKRIWHKLKAKLATEYMTLEDLAAEEKEWEENNPMMDGERFWGAGAALAILEYAREDWEAPALSGSPVRTVVEDAEEISKEIQEVVSSSEKLDLNPETPKPKPILKLRTPSPELGESSSSNHTLKVVKVNASSPVKRNSTSFWRKSRVYVPGPYAASTGKELEDHSFANDASFWATGKWAMLIAENGLEWGIKQWVHRYNRKPVEKNNKHATEMIVSTNIDMGGYDEDGSSLEGSDEENENTIPTADTTITSENQNEETSTTPPPNSQFSIDINALQNDSKDFPTPPNSPKRKAESDPDNEPDTKKVKGETAAKDGMSEVRATLEETEMDEKIILTYKYQLGFLEIPEETNETPAEETPAEMEWDGVGPVDDEAWEDVSSGSAVEDSDEDYQDDWEAEVVGDLEEGEIREEVEESSFRVYVDDNGLPKAKL